MQLVIEISDGLYNNLGTIKNGSIASKIILDCVRKGQVLPKGHGALKDADKLNDYFWDNRSRLFHSSDCRVAIDKADTIIEADKD